MNAKEEFMDHVGCRVVLCAYITYSEESLFLKMVEDYSAILPIGYSDEQFESFLNLLDFEYDNGFGVQEVYGNIWYANGCWSDRSEYDGSECWKYISKPEIPYFLK